MANPTSRWDFVPVWGVYLNPVTNAPSGGKVSFALASRITRVDGRVIYPDGASVVVQIGLHAEQDAEIRSIVRAAWRAADETAAGEDWYPTGWDTWWNTIIVAAAVFTRFPAADDPDIVQTDWSVTVREQLTSAGGKQYAIQPLLAHLDLPIPGINLGLIEVPPGAPGVPAPMYAKAVPGGVASLDSAGKVPLEQLPDDIGGGGEPGLSAEEAVAAVASSLVEGDGVTITYDDGAGTISITADTPSPGVASTTSQGVVELATTAEATAGTDTTRAVTPAGVKAVADGRMPQALSGDPGRFRGVYGSVPESLPDAQVGDWIIVTGAS